MPKRNKKRCDTCGIVHEKKCPYADVKYELMDRK